MIKRSSMATLEQALKKMAFDLLNNKLKAWDPHWRYQQLWRADRCLASV